MLQIKDISRAYVTGELVQHALKGINLNFRQKEFVSILGPSGSGKTTLLNIIGGLDRYDLGDLVINNISTRFYKDRDWDSYRNHTIGFIFQSYNLIPHQSLLANVELALTLSGIPRKERIERAKKALEEVGLAQHIHKRPNQLSGGQMQRVAIARALVNNPDILLADEPTGALDSETSVQIMNLLQEVAKDRLVIMVTHNPELAEEYSTRTIKLRDGRVIADSNPYEIDSELAGQEIAYKNLGKSSMGLKTSLALSFNNLRTKKGRTLLTAYAGSIGIIGISLILALSNGVNAYIAQTQEETMTSYPILIESEAMNLNSMIMTSTSSMFDSTKNIGEYVYADNTELATKSDVMSSIEENNLSAFKQYLDNPESPIHDFIGKNGIVYTYDVPFDVYSINSKGYYTSVKTNTFETDEPAVDTTDPMTASMMDSMMSQSTSDYFEQLIPGTDGELVSTITKESYELLSGDWPQDKHEVMLVLNENNQLPIYLLYAMGLIPEDEYTELVESAQGGHEIESSSFEFMYDSLLQTPLHLVLNSDTYTLNANDLYEQMGTSQSELRSLIDDSIELKVSGIIRPTADAENATLTGAIAYTSALTDLLIDETAKSAVVIAQQASPQISVLNGFQFNPEDDLEKIDDTIDYLLSLDDTTKAGYMLEFFATDEERVRFSAASEASLANLLETRLTTQPDNKTILSLYDEVVAPGTYDDNLATFGMVSKETPTSVSLYIDTFEDKESITEAIADYNDSVHEEDAIIYTDFVGLMTTSMTVILNIITYILIAFIAVSLMVSSIMIGIITYISVVERTKEIGILRAMGASKRNISRVFNAETFIIGTLSGIIGIGFTSMSLVSINTVLQTLLDDPNIKATLPLPTAIGLVILSILLTLFGGYMPAKKAALKDPVTALRSE